MQAAVELFLSKGFAATSLEEVVARSGGSLATVYQLFGNKQGLWQALVQERTQQLTAPLRDPTPAVHDNPREVLLQMARSLMSLVRSPECGGAYRLILAEGSRSPDLARAMYENGPEACQKQVADYLREQTARGALQVPDPDLAAEQFGNLVAGDLALQNACGMAPQRPPAEIERRLTAAVDLFLRGYAAR